MTVLFDRRATPQACCSSFAPAVPPLFRRCSAAVIVAVPLAVIPLFLNNSGMFGKILIMNKKIERTLQHNSGENKKSRGTAGNSGNRGRGWARGRVHSGPGRSKLSPIPSTW
ncbi:hypothetical protein ABC974_18060 [Sphingomonas oligophenolica]|uniref:Uncharacterized protein n=1 Tax=Sphingomonas oligophenolica TaxID=301154 RepID=A0ABU9Y6V8_9SPHN